MKEIEGFAGLGLVTGRLKVPVLWVYCSGLEPEGLGLMTEEVTTLEAWHFGRVHSERSWISELKLAAVLQSSLPSGRNAGLPSLFAQQLLPGTSV